MSKSDVTETASAEDRASLTRKDLKTSNKVVFAARETYCGAGLDVQTLRKMMMILASGGDWNQLEPPKSTLEIPNYNREMVRTETHFRRIAFGSVVVYALLVWFSYTVAGDECVELSKVERGSATLALVCHVVSLTLQLMPMYVQRAGHPISGIVFAAIILQLIAMTTNAIMAFGSPPVLIDPITGSPVHLLRWSEWTPLAFAMTFLVEGSDIPDRRWRLSMAYTTAFTQGLSTLCGLLFPLCPGLVSWVIVMVIAFLLFGFMFFRLRYREERFRRIKKGKRLHELEIYNRSAISLKLLRTCTIGWTFLVGMYMIFCVLCPLVAPEDSILRDPAIPMISDAIADVILKVFYMAFIVNLHEQVFDEGARAKRRLEELRQMMWDTSSDVLAISVVSLSGIVTTMVSPTFFKMLREGKAPKDSLKSGELPVGDRGMIFELPAKDLESLLDKGSGASRPVVQPKLSDFDFGGFSIQNVTQKVQASHDVTKLIGKEEIQALATLMARSWQCEERDTLLAHELVLRNEKSDLETIQCEAKVTRLEESALFLVVRDISERFRRFEAEKKAVSEMTARRKDSEANRFTRHEVKNGLLAALGLSDSLAETMKGAADSLSRLAAALGDEQAEEIAKLSTAQDNVSSLVTEMDSAIHEVLETILTEAMARDVIHGIYVPELEQVDIVALLASMSRHAKGQTDRFPIVTSPQPFPTLLFDPHLLKCIHRNAVSNAAKYGKRGGVVTTHLKYDPNTRILEMDITNAPGDNHDEIIKLGAKGAASVFSPGHRLHSKLGGGDAKSSVGRQSSGDGAWIMQQCANTLGGECRIEFHRDRTVFSFRCPAVLFETTRGDRADDAFKLPKDIWGIALDDSKMQRKLLKRFLLFAGVSEDRIIVMGETAEEINNFDDFMYDFIGSHPNDMFLLIVDENLDLEEQGVSFKHSCVSGSLLVQRLRHRLLREQERQTVALIRSANDSSHDVAIYKSRAHGFLPKAPIKKDKIPALLAPIWQERFAAVDEEASVTSSVHSQSMTTFMTDATDEYGTLMEHIRKIDTAVSEESEISDRWPEIWQKLHAFKGDLLSMQESEEATEVVKKINEMRGRNLPVNFLMRWHTLRELAVKLAFDSYSLSDMDDLGDSINS